MCVRAPHKCHRRPWYSIDPFRNALTTMYTNRIDLIDTRILLSCSKHDPTTTNPTFYMVLSFSTRFQGAFWVHHNLCPPPSIRFVIMYVGILSIGRIILVRFLVAAAVLEPRKGSTTAFPYYRIQGVQLCHGTLLGPGR